MKPVTLACFILLASAFVLAGLLVVRVDRLTPAAEAQVVDRHGEFVSLTARTGENEDTLFLLDSYSQRLLIFRTDIGRKRLELARTVSVESLFSGAGGGIGDRGGPRRTPR